MEQQQVQQPWYVRLLLWIKELILNSDFQATEAQSGLLAALWGIVLLWPGWDIFSASASFRIMALIAPEWAWGVCILWIGVTQMFAMYAGKLRYRRICTFLIACFWALLAGLLAAANYRTTGPYIYAALSLSAGWAYWRMPFRSRE